MSYRKQYRREKRILTKGSFRRNGKGLKYSDRPEWKWKLVGDDGVHIEFMNYSLPTLGGT